MQPPTAFPVLPTAADLSAAVAAVHRAPQDARTHYALSRIYIGLRRAADGEAELVAATRLNPRYIQAFRALQRYDKLAGYLDREIETLQHLQKLEPQRVEYLVRLGEIYMRLYWVEAAGACLTRALQLSPQDLAANLAMAKYEVQIRRPAGAVERLKAMHAMVPDDSETANLLAQYLLATGHGPEGEAVLRDALQRHAGDRMLTQTRIYNLVMQGGELRSHQALDLAGQFLQTYGPSAEVYCWMGRAYEQLGMSSEAESAYRNAIRIDPSVENSTYLLGRLYLRSGRIAEGKRLTRYYAQIDSHLQTYIHTQETMRAQMNHPDAHLAMANLDLGLHYNAEAVVEYRRVLELKPGDAEARAGLRNALIASGRRVEAETPTGYRGVAEALR